MKEYLSHVIKRGKENQTVEIKRRIKLTWIAFGKLSHIVKIPDIPINLKRTVSNASILPVTTYGLETKALTKKYTNNLSIMGHGTGNARR